MEKGNSKWNDDDDAEDNENDNDRTTIATTTYQQTLFKYPPPIRTDLNTMLEQKPTEKKEKSTHNFYTENSRESLQYVHKKKIVTNTMKIDARMVGIIKENVRTDKK